MSSKIIFQINKKGEVSINVDGILGANCEQITKVFTDALHGEMNIEYKPEYFLAVDEMQLYEKEEV